MQNMRSGHGLKHKKAWHNMDSRLDITCIRASASGCSATRQCNFVSLKNINIMSSLEDSTWLAQSWKYIVQKIFCFSYWNLEKNKKILTKPTCALSTRDYPQHVKWHTMVHPLVGEVPTARHMSSEEGLKNHLSTKGALRTTIPDPVESIPQNASTVCRKAIFTIWRDFQ